MPTRSYSDARARISGAPRITVRGGGRADLAPEFTHQNALTWRFERASDGRWKWRKIDQNPTLTCDSGRFFASYESCIADAVEAGYKPLLPAVNLVPLSLSHEAAPIPRALAVSVDDVSPKLPRRSTVLKKRVAHPAIERIFGKRRTPAVTRTRAAVLASSPKPHANQSRVKKLKRA